MRPSLSPPPGPHDSGGRTLVLLPVYNDWESCKEVVKRVDGVFAATDRRGEFLLVDDGSEDPPEFSRVAGDLHATDAVHLLRLRRNLGHQRAICVGLSLIEAEFPCDAVIVMDADGEDDPEDIPRLLDRWEAEGRTSIVFAERTRRSEGLVFRASYWTYRVLHRILTGLGVRVGNFSVIPAGRLSSLVLYPELWSHYAAAVFVSRIPFVTVPTRRSQRISGHSHMNYQALVAHGLSAVTVFSEVVGVRVLLANLAMVFAGTFGLLFLFAASLTQPWEFPTWMTYVSGLLMIAILLSIMFAFLFTFIILFERKSGSMIPARDAPLFMGRLERIFPQGNEPPSSDGRS